MLHRAQLCKVVNSFEYKANTLSRLQLFLVQALCEFYITGRQCFPVLRCKRVSPITNRFMDKKVHIRNVRLYGNDDGIV